MTGREERDQKNNEIIEKNLNGKPQIIKDFMISISSLTSATRRQYVMYLNEFYEFIMQSGILESFDYSHMSEIKKMHIDQYMEFIRYNKKNHKENGVSIRNAKLAAITTFFDFLLDNDFVQQNVCKKMKKIKDNREKQVISLTKDEVKQVQDSILSSYRSFYSEDPWKYRDYAIFVLGCTTGMRQSAIREINMEDLDLKKRTVNVTEKDNVVKTMPLGDKTYEAIIKWIEVRGMLLGDKECNALFISNRRQRISIGMMDRIITKHTQDINKHITPHKLRSTCAMNLYEATGDIYLVAQQLGHKSIQNTQIYAKATQEKMRETAELMDRIYE